MKKLLVLIGAVCLMLPALAAGNANPHLYLEIFDFGATEPDPVPGYVCICMGPPIQDFAPKSAGLSVGYLAVHVGRVEDGYSGLHLGIQSSGGAVIFASTIPCPGFTKGYSMAGEPAAVFVFSEVCHPWQYHACYLRYFTTTICATSFEIVPNADVGHNKVVNCDNEYDEGTTIGGGAQWGSEQTGVETSTWGKIKALYR